MTQVDGGGVPAGTQLNGIYEVEKRIAIGGMGEVYTGRAIQTGDKVAIKMILPEHAGNELIVDLFRREASTLHNLYHEAIVRYFVFSVDPALNRPYLAMEFARGPSLGERLREGPLDERELSVLRRRIAGGLHAAHTLGIVHRDISPDNIILVDGEVEKAKIIDFGIAKSTHAEGTLIGSGFAGKLNYVSPEQLGLQGGTVTGKSDIYSLGLVFAEAVVGRPLPMGGSQLEVIDKRRALPDLGQVPVWIRPLIETMVQPDPEDRPADMRAVADWSPSGAAAAAGAAAVGGAAGPPVHPRERRRQQQAGRDGPKIPWLWLGLGGAGIATLALAAFLVFGTGEPGDETPTGTGATKPALAGKLKSPAEAVEAPEATEGERYAWTSEPFAYDGLVADLRIVADGALPHGLALEAGTDGRARIVGTPTLPGAYQFAIVAAAPTGETARQAVRLTVDPDMTTAIVETEPEPSVAAAAPTETPVAVTPAEPVPDAGSAEPSVATGGPADLLAPADDRADDPGTGALAAGSDAAPSLGQPGAPALPQAVPGRPSIPPADTEPAADEAAPDENTPASAAAGPGETDAPPQEDAETDDEVAAIPPPENRPPSVEGPFPDPLSAAPGEQLNVRLGSFSDEEAASALSLKVEGLLPEGVAVRLAEGGVAELHGQPAEAGEFRIEVAAVDPQGLVSKTIPVTLSIVQPDEHRAVRDYILGYEGGDCFLSRPVELGPELARIEVFASEAAIQRVLAFDADFKREMGFEAKIGMRPVSDAQCALVDAVDALGAQMLENPLAIELGRDELAAGETLEGRITGGEGVRLFLFDHLGGLTDLSGFLAARGDVTGFSVPITAAGPQILIAIAPRAGAELPPDASPEEVLGAAERGAALLALGFFMMKG